MPYTYFYSFAVLFFFFALFLHFIYFFLDLQLILSTGKSNGYNILLEFQNITAHMY